MLGLARSDALQSSIDVPCNLQRPQGVGRQVGVSIDVDIPSTSIRCHRNVQQFNSGVRRDVTPATL